MAAGTGWTAVAVTGWLIAAGMEGVKDAQVTKLASWMAGSFTSAEQAASAPDDFSDVRLHVVPIWTERVDGAWLYVEQAAASSLEKPYRQRVYQLVRRERNVVESRVYTLPNPPLFVGAWRSPNPLAMLRPEDLSPRAGCEVVLSWDKKAKAFAGSTFGTSCPSDLRGASHATTEIRVTSDGMTSWDRGYDASGKQVWGAEKGPYRFAKER